MSFQNSNNDYSPINNESIISHISKQIQLRKKENRIIKISQKSKFINQLSQAMK